MNHPSHFIEQVNFDNGESKHLSMQPFSRYAEKITKYPLFGKAHIEVSDFGDLCYHHPGTNLRSIPAISGAPVTVEAEIYSDLKVNIFSNGSEADGWMCGNCFECKKYNADAAEPTDLIKGGCALEMRLAYAAVDDGKIPFKTAKRIGYRGISIQRNGVFVRLSECNEKISK